MTCVFRNLTPFLFAATAALTPARAFAQMGDTTDALPGVVRVPVVDPDARGLAVAGSAGYGYTESILGNGDAYSRASGSLAVSYQPVSYFAAALRFDGRYDVDTGSQSASGASGDPRLELRGMTAVGSAFRLGGQIGVWTPGSAAPSFPARAITPDVSVLATYAPPGSSLILASRVGFRWDNSTQSVPNASQLALPDRVELGLNQASAVLTGLGASYRLSPRLDLLGDVTWDLLVGKGAPSVTDAPILMSAGARYVLDGNGKLQAQVVLTACPSGRPTVTPAAPLVDIEPRVTALVGLVFRPFAERPAPATEVVSPASGPAAPPTPTRARFSGRAIAEDGRAPLAHAHVVVTPESGADKQETDTDADGRFETGDLDYGPVTVVITAPGYKPVTKTVVISGTPTPFEVSAAHALPAGEVRGVVRDLTGKPLRATIRIEPGGVDVALAADGTFHSDVQPGAYDVIIHAPGYIDQKRHVVVERDAVVLLNVDMRKPSR